jgi:hypothetical protein
MIAVQASLGAPRAGRTTLCLKTGSRSNTTRPRLGPRESWADLIGHTGAGERVSLPGCGWALVLCRHAPSDRPRSCATNCCAPMLTECRRSRRGLRSNFGATTPKHHRKPAIIRDQKTKPGIIIDNLVRSANLHPRFKSGRRLQSQAQSTLPLTGVAVSSVPGNLGPFGSKPPSSRCSTSSTARRCDASTTCVYLTAAPTRCAPTANLGLGEIDRRSTAEPRVARYPGDCGVRKPRQAARTYS